MASTSIHNAQGSGAHQPQSNAPSAARDHGHIEPGEIAVGVVIGRASEYFDFFVYALASVLVFPAIFFPFEQRLEGTLYAFVIFAFAFLARPVGTVIFMAIQRAYGRELKLTLALFLLGFSTAGIALLPTFDHIGVWAIILLSLLRVGQGIALGGAWDGLPSLLAMNAPQNKRGWYAALGQLGAPTGFIIAASLFAYMLANLTTEDFLDWGWRFPFYVAFAINVVALFARLRLVSAPEYAKLLDERELEPAGAVELISTQGRNIIIGALAALASYALFHLVTVFPLSWIKLYSLRETADFLVVQIWGGVIMAAGIVISGAVADRFGRRTTLGSMALLIAILSAFVPTLMNGGEAGQNTFILIGFALLGLSYGQAAGAVTANFQSRYRYTGAALTQDVAWLVGAGFAPLVALGLSAHFGMAYVSFYLLSGAVGSLAALSLNRALESKEE
ncbi:MFS transporter [Herbaspirillum sp. LeCh32-8]|uniref:MFS transporter n=1 Tax=Herbaspirillum sp. LeCh32-8 TaxID=2821356 RepID=UPI001AE4456B|nr:MFS transporter [Herbaspirillum sp. LeCh32-8]MBP0597412.1 MFS transporter [Herbaspirillum sp. LeCh32-8]